MRFLLVAALLVSVLGCKTPTRYEPPKKAPGRKVGSSKVIDPSVRPANELGGKVISVNDTLRFVVIDFAATRLPRPDQRLSVYRSGQRVGIVRISGQFRQSNAAADILTGDARVGDDVRAD